MALKVLEEKSPLLRPPPPIALAFAIEVNRIRRDPIEPSTEIRQLLVRPDRPDPAFDVEEIEQLCEEREFVDIQAQRRVPQMLKHEGEEPSTAPQIEHRARRAAVQFQILGADNVQAKPTLYLSVFGVVLGRRRIPPLQFRQLRLIDPGIERLKRDRVNKAFRPTPRSPVGQGLGELGDFVREPHLSGGSPDAANNDPARTLVKVRE